jgi:short-subunit dehydrogenase
MKVKLKALGEQVMVITGASSGIGLATAYMAAERGAMVVLAARNAEVLAEVERQIQAKGGRAIHVVADVGKREDIERIATDAIAAFGHIDTWVNNAGNGVFGRLMDVSDQDHRQIFETNFWGVVYGTTTAAKYLKAQGGAIINLGSVASDIAFPIQGMYAASKHAIKGFTDAFRMEMEEAGEPISVTLIKPTSINTPFPAHAKNYLDKAPKLPPPVYSPEDVAEAIVYAAEHGGRDYYIGGAGKMMSQFSKVAPLVTDWVGAHMIPRQSARDEPAGDDKDGALHQPSHGGEVHGDSPHHVMRSTYTKASMRPMISSALIAGAGVVAAGLLNRTARWTSR